MDDKSVICGLAFQCPYENREEGCPLYYMEGKRFIEKLALIDEMTPQARAYVLQKYAGCRNKLSGYEKW